MSFNSLKTVLLLGLLTGLLVVGGGALAGRNGLYLGLALAVVMNFFSYFFSDKLALASYSAQPVTPEENPEAYRRVAPIVQGLAQRMGIPMPKLYIIPEASAQRLCHRAQSAACLRGLHRRHSPVDERFRD